MDSVEPVDAVWPPPPLNQGQNGTEASEITVEFRTEFRFLEGSVPNFRCGAVRVSSEGILVDGWAILPYEYQLPIFIIGLLLPPIWMIAYFMMEYGLRNREVEAIAGNQVRRIAFSSWEQRVCIVYEAQNFKGEDKVYSLTFPLNNADYEDFLAIASQHWPEKVGAAKLRYWTSPINWAFGGSLLTICACLFAVLLFEAL